LHLPNTPHFVIGFFAALMAGGRVVVRTFWAQTELMLW
jgi:acyl-CoA synthetase (AMP-forming)/AMP-acid ligase II